MEAIQGGPGILPPGRKVRGSGKPLAWLRPTPFPHMPATAQRSGHVRLIVRGQMYDGRMTIYTYIQHVIFYSMSVVFCASANIYR